MPDVQIKCDIKKEKNRTRAKPQAKKGKKILKGPKKAQAKTSGGQYKCPHCPITFDKYQSLGGHKSKAHAGQSEDYARKMRIRAGRTGARMLLEEAKTILKETNPDICRQSSDYVTKLNKIKAELKKKAADNQAL